MPDALYNEVKDDEVIGINSVTDSSNDANVKEINTNIVSSNFTLAPSGTIFKDISIGGTTLQYTVNNSGMFSFGDGTDGELSTTGNVTLTADKYYTNLTINNGHTFNPAGYRIFCTKTLTVKNGGILQRNGNNGSAGVGNNGGAGAVALADGYLKGSPVGGNGGYGSAGTPPQNGTATSNSLGSNGADGGVGGGGGTLYGAGGVATASNVKLIANWHLFTLLDIGATGSPVKFDNSASSGGGGASLTGSGGNLAAGGGGANAGGIIAIYAKDIIVESGGSINANGGNGGNGSEAYTPGGSGGGGGAGNGGEIILAYNSLTNNGTIQAAAGTPGQPGEPYGGSSGAVGGSGTAGHIRYINVSL